MRVSVSTYDETGDLRHLLFVDWEAIPRRGDTVQLTGLMFGSEDTETSYFEVDDVVFAAEIDDRHDIHVEVPSIIVATRRAEVSFIPFCTCGPGDAGPNEHHPDRCGNCGDRLRKRQRR